MKADVVLAGVGGQGVLTVASLLAEAGFREGLVVAQGELHGMSQRGGAVQATVRLANHRVAGDLVPLGTADVVLGLEPLEALRCLPSMAPGGTLLASTEKKDALAGYPADVLDRVAAAGGVLVDAVALARSVQAPRSANVVMVGAALPLLPLAPLTVAACIRDRFAKRAADRNLAALRAGLGVAARS